MPYQHIAIEVQSYAGYKGDQEPRQFKASNRWIRVEQVLDQWYEGSLSYGKPVINYFKVQAENGLHYLLRHEVDSDAWYLVK